MDQVQASPPSQDWSLNRVQQWKLKLCWLPKKCFLSGKNLWGCWAYHGINAITGPGDPVIDHFWVDRHEFIIWNLRGRK